MRIEFDPATLSPLSARALIRLINDLTPGKTDPVADLADDAVFPTRPPQPDAPSIAAVAASPTAPAVQPEDTPVLMPFAIIPAAPTPAPVVSAPTVPADPTTPVPDADAQGLPWDARIHSGGKTRNADGTWRKKSKLDPALEQAVIAELRGVMSAPPAIPQPPVPAATDAAQLGATFAGMMRDVTNAITRGKTTMPQVNALCSQFGVPELSALMHRPDLWAPVNAGIQKLMTP